MTLVHSFDNLSIGAGHIQTEDGYWIWQGPRDAAGYGIYHSHGTRQKAHRAYFKAAYGESALPRDWSIHHVCEIKSCVNPAHLEALPQHVHFAHHQIAAKRRLSTTERQEIREAACDPDVTLHLALLLWRAAHELDELVVANTPGSVLDAA